LEKSAPARRTTTKELRYAQLFLFGIVFPSGKLLEESIASTAAAENQNQNYNSTATFTA
jgi:hypothetical protein